MSDAFYPTFRYHPVLAPEGRKFTDREAFESLSDEWVDTPAAFPVPDEAEKTGEEPENPGEPAARRRGRPRNTEAGS